MQERPSMAADEVGLMRAVLADPWDELARSAYADWLEEQGAGRRWEVAMERMKEDAPCPFAADINREGLLCVYMEARSFGSKAFAARGPDWLRRSHVAEVQIRGLLGEVLSRPILSPLQGLSLACLRISAEGVKALAESPHLANLASLNLYAMRGQNFHSYGAGSLASIFRGGALRALCRLDLGLQFQANAADIRALAKAPFAPSLRNLSLPFLRDIQHPRALQALVSSPSLDGLVTLRLECSPAEEAVVEALVTAPRLPGLRNLLLGGLAPEAACELLAASPLLPRLHRLQLDVAADPGPLGSLARAVAATPHCRLSLLYEDENVRAILGERLIVEEAS
jgi:uncharacterized protein (TIGR02996 family)